MVKNIQFVFSEIKQNKQLQIIKLWSKLTTFELYLIWYLNYNLNNILRSLIKELIFENLVAD